MTIATKTKPELKIIGATPREGCYCTPAAHPDTEGLAQRARILSALADPTRLGIVEMLAGLDEPLCVCDIVSGFSLGQPTISHHLKVLREARLVNWEKRGLWVYYSLNRETLGEVGAHLGGLVSARK